jgi:hypothetical protein
MGFNVLIGDVDPELQGFVHSEFHSSPYRFASIEISVVAALERRAEKRGKRTQAA